MNWLTIVLLVVGFVVLIKGADWLVNGSSNLARLYGVSELVIGLTVVAFGTSTPELIVNVLAGINEYNEVAYGNILGSNIFNLLFILGVAGLIYPISVQKQTIVKEVPLSLLAAMLLLFLVNDQFLSDSAINILTRWDALILLIFFIGFLIYVFKNLKKETKDEQVKAAPLWKSILFIVLGLAGLIVGGNLVVENAILLGEAAGMSQKLIGLTIVAAGTSLPELATSAVAAFKKNSDIAVGNVIGSNIFNIFFILGISGAITPIPYDTILNIDMLILIAGTALFLLFMFTAKRNKVDRWEAGLMLAGYLVYLGYLIIRN